MSISLQPKGTTYTQALMAIAAAHDNNLYGAISIAETRYGQNAPAAMVLKAAVAAGGSANTMWGSQVAEVRLAEQDFIEGFRQRTIVGRLQGLRNVPSRTSVPTGGSSLATYWVGEGAPKPLSADVFGRTTLDTTKIAGIAVLSNELMRMTGQVATNLVRADLGAAAAKLTDTSFIDPAFAGSAGVSPASVTNGAPSFASTGTLAKDVELAIDNFTGDLENAAWVTSPALGAGMGLRSGSGAVAVDVGARGGTLAGLPLLTTSAVTHNTAGGSLILLDPSAILVADEGIAIRVSSQTSLQMLDNPTNSSKTGTGTSMVSMYQTNSSAFLVERFINWKVGRTGSVVVITGATY